MKQLYLYLHIPTQPVLSLAEEWHKIAVIDTCYTALMADIVEQFRLGDEKRGISGNRQLILVTAGDEESALEIAKTKL